MVMTPVMTHAINSQKGDPTVRLMSAETMKMPDPIIDPATSMVASVSVIALTNSRDDWGVSAVSGWVVNAHPLVLVSAGLTASCTAWKSYSARGGFARE